MEINNHLFSIRRDFAMQTLDEATASHDPLLQFEKWYSDAITAQIPESNAFILSTVSKESKPSSRVVLLREYHKGSFIFYSNYNSRKGEEIENNPAAAMLFFWPQLERQIRIEGTIEKYNAAASDDYFSSRPYESKIGAWASEQSKILTDRKVLDDRIEQFKKDYQGDVPRPEHWGGYILKADYFEFWQGRSSRLHDRLAYNFRGDSWKRSRLAP